VSLAQENSTFELRVQEAIAKKHLEFFSRRDKTATEHYPSCQLCTTTFLTLKRLDFQARIKYHREIMETVHPV
jgi:hypothetical protein